jgi:hypothetical protein
VREQVRPALITSAVDPSPSTSESPKAIMAEAAGGVCTTTALRNGQLISLVAIGKCAAALELPAVET